ncbi:uncharacterized protein LOC116348834 [Contarinia nasturtii]|uniref:uncharacterized protein LOC116348834 n=1 Tax=Contarinia nasturtii TaxID=265458 RepID=UPI0012D41C3E|nr:uncharacterized protein LOC116348834 [Contarinia nasturtii]
MNFDQSNTSANDIPIAESTKIEKSAKTPLKRLRYTLANRFGFHSNPNSPSGTPQTRKNSTSINSSTLTKLDPQVYLDTQSNGFASRVVKYHDESVAKGRNITNKVYRRPGDFPIVNLDKSEINLNKKQANVPTVSKINIAPPINLVSASNASARSTIFRTGKNYGDSYQIGKLGPIEARKPIKTVSPSAHNSTQNEPIVPTNNDYDSAPIRSSLEALKEISRKRIHCDEIDGDTNKKQRADNDYESNNAQVAITSKRARDRTSPSFSSSAAEMQQKRYKNNDILSSLSSSILMSTPKRSALNADVTASKIRRPEFNYDRDDANESVLTNSCAIGKSKSEPSGVVGTSKSDLPHHPSEPIKPVTKSMSDGYDPKSSTTKTNKLTLFNKVYSATSTTGEKKKPIDDDDENSITFVKPKAKASSIFSVNKNRDQKSKLAMMLSFLRGDESKDEVDSVGKPSIDSEKSNQKEEPKSAISSSTSANLNTTTSVTFSTATTTSLLNVPSDVTKPSISEPQKFEAKIPTVVTKPIESSATPLISLSTAASTTAPPSTAITTTIQNSPKVSTENAIKPTVTFNLPPTTAATSIATTSASDSAPRLGGFSFSATQTAFTSPLVAKPTATESLSIAKTEENKPAPPSFSFGLTKSTTNTTLPSFTPPTFGSNTLPAKTESTPASTQSSIVTAVKPQTGAFQFGNTTSSTPATFNLDSSASKPSVLTFTPNNNTSTNNTNSTLNQTPSMPFAFGSTSNTSKPDLNTSITSASIAPFAFSATTASTSAPPVFGSTHTVTTSTNAIPAQNQTSSPPFSFGGAVSAASAAKPQTGAFQFGNTTTTSVVTPSFGSPSVSTPLFGMANPTSSITATTQSGAFTFGANKSTAGPKFGETTATVTPAFGSTITTTATTTNLFGNAQNTSVFGTSNLTATQPKTENVFGAANQTTNTPVFGSQNQSNTFGKTPSAPAFGSNNNLFGNTQSTNAQIQPPPAFGTSNNNLFSTQTTSANLNQSNSLFSTQTTSANLNQSNSAFGSTTAAAAATPSGVFAFGGQQTPATTTASTGIFGTTNTNTNANAPFVFGQGNSMNLMQSNTPSQPSGIFGSKTVENSLTAPPAFGSTTPVAKPQTGAFQFGNTTTPSVPAFGSNSATPQFGGATNGIGSSFAFSATNQPEAAKPFNFGGPSTAPAESVAPFSFNSPSAAPAQNAFQFNAAPQQPTTNMFSIGPGSSTTKTGRPMRTATRRMK